MRPIITVVSNFDATTTVNILEIQVCIRCDDTKTT